MEQLVVDTDRRTMIERELPRLPLDYFTEEVPVPDDWADRVASSYLWFSAVYEPDADEAARRGWPVVHVAGGHLHMVVAPDQVAAALVAILGPF
jgi:hypothetical protein